MGAFLDKPNTTIHNEDGRGNSIAFGWSSMQGWRIEMEDAHAAVLGLPGLLKEWSYFAVFDGHAGSKVSMYCAENLLTAILDSTEFTAGIKTGELSTDDAMEGIRKGFLILDEKMRALPEVQSGEDKSGSTAICAVLSPKHIYFGNCGDSRAIMVRSHEVQLSTVDHKPMLPTERERIHNAGGNVIIQRVNGSLAVSRALGDYEYKNKKGRGQCEQMVSPEPEIYVEARNNDGDEFMVLACDGVWDVMTNVELLTFITHRLHVTDNLSQICNEVIHTCLSKGSRDNMSIILVSLPACPGVNEEDVKKEEELNTSLENKVKEIVESCNSRNDEFDVSSILHLLSKENIPGLPPGGDLFHKRALVEEIFRRHVPDKDSSSEDNADNDDGS